MIDHYEFGRITVDGKAYTSDIIIFPDHVDGHWWRREGHELCVDDLGKILPEKPEFLVVGTGHAGLVRILDETKSFLLSCGIEFIAEPTTQACKIYNWLAPTKKVIAALHLTC